MIKNYQDEISKILCFIFSKQETTSFKIGLFFTMIQKFQEISLVINSQENITQDLKSLLFLANVFVINDLSIYQMKIMIVFATIVHIAFIYALLYFSFTECQIKFLYSILHNFIVRYPQFFFIPNILINGTVFLTNNNDKESFEDSKLIGLWIIFSIFNIIIGLVIKLLHIYFARTTELLQNDNILLLHYSFIFNLVSELLLFGSLIQQLVNGQKYINMILIILRSIIMIYRLLDQDNCKYYIWNETFLIVSISALIIDLSSEYYFIILTFCIALITQAILYIQGILVTTINQSQLNILQKLETELQRLKNYNMKSKLILTIMFQNHQCTKCKEYSEMNICIFKRMANKEYQTNTQIILLYCKAISNTTPLKALTRIFLVEDLSYYGKGCAKVFALQLKSNQIISQYNFTNLVDINKFNIKLFLETDQFCQKILPLIQQIINQKIYFWGNLIKGYYHIGSCVNDVLNTSKLLLECQKYYYEIFDMNKLTYKQTEKTNIIIMRIIQIYYSSTYQNYKKAYIIEKKISELLSQENQKYNLIPNNYQLMNNLTFIFQSSLVFSRGELINLNYEKLAYFMNTDESKVKSIVHCQQLMPNFIAEIHDQLMDNAYHQGFCKLEDQGRSSFMINVNGFLEPCQLNLHNYYNGKDDYILNLIVSKTQNDTIQVLFGLDGKILGYNQLFFQQLFKNELEKLQNTSENEEQNIQNFNYLLLQKGSLIQYYISNIAEIIQDLRKVIKQQRISSINTIKSFWQFPKNHQQCLNSTNWITGRFQERETKFTRISKLSNQQDKKQSYKKKQLSKYTTILQFQSKQLDYILENNCEQDIDIENQKVMLLHQEFQEQIKDLVQHNNDEETSSILEITFNISFQEIKYLKGAIGFFQLSITDQKLQNTKSTLAKTLTYQSEILKQSFHFTDQFEQYEEFELYENQEKQKEQIAQNVKFCEENPQQPTNNYSFLFTQREANNNNHDMNIILNNGQNGQTKNTLYEEVIQQESQQISQMISKSIVEDDKNVTQNKGKQKSYKIKSHGNENDYISTNSKVSSGQNHDEAIVLLSQLSLKQELITPLKKTVILFFFSLIALILIIPLNLVLIYQNLNDQIQNIQRLVGPQSVNYYYTSALFEMWSLELDYNEVLPLSDLMHLNVIQNLNYMISDGQTYIPDSITSIPRTVDSTNLSQQFSMKFYTPNNTLIQQNVSLISLFSIIYQETLEYFFTNNNSQTIKFDQLYSNGTIRRNILLMEELVRQIIYTLADQIFYQQQDVQSYFLKILFTELFIELFFIFITIRYLLQKDNIIRLIILLISRITENQAIIEISKLNLIKNIFQNFNSSFWKGYNFSQILLQNEGEISKITFSKIELYTDQKQTSYKKDGQLLNRIQNTNYINKMNYVIVFCQIILVLTFYLAGYFIHMNENQSFQHSLTTAVKYGQYRQNMDSSTYLAGLIKSENLIKSNNVSMLNQSRIISLLEINIDLLGPLMQEISDSILQNEIETGNSYFDEILHQEMCNTSYGLQQKTCYPANYNLSYSSNDYIGDVVSNGILGYHSALMNYLNSEFEYEMNNLQYDTVENNQKATSTKQFNNFILGYFCDIQDLFLQILLIFQQFNQDNASALFNVLLYYYLICGITLFITFIISEIFWIKWIQRRVLKIRQILALLPLSSIENQSIKNQAKRILNQLH